jgi:hypothetical protein
VLTVPRAALPYAAVSLFRFFGVLQQSCLDLLVVDNPAKTQRFALSYLFLAPRVGGRLTVRVLTN